MADQPMPPQGGAAPAQAPAPDDAQQGGDQGQGQGGGIADFIVGLDGNLSKFAALIEKAQVPDSVKKDVQTSLESFRSAVAVLTNGDQGGQAPADAGSAPMQAGGNSGAQPAY